MSYKTLSGTWTKQADGSIKGLVDASLSARCVAGSENDENYEFYATVKITTGKACALCNFTYSEDWEERYLEMVLDPTGDTVKLDAVIRNADGTEKSRTTLASRNMSLATATEYRLRFVTKKLADGSYAVYGYIDDFCLVEAEDLAADFQKGMHGLECLGTANQYSEFSQLAKIVNPYCSLDDVRSVLQLKPDDHEDDAEIIESIISAKGWVDTELDKHDLGVPSVIPQNIRDATKFYASWLFRRSRDPAGAKVFFDEAVQFLSLYVDAESETSFKVAQA